MQKTTHLYSGKAKTVFNTQDPDKLILCFRDDTSAFDGKKVDQLENKGMVNNKFNAFIMRHLAERGVANHFEKLISDNESLVKKLDMLPIECVVRNIAAGSICKRLGVKKGMELNPPIFEFFYKDDELGDPLINESHIISFGWAQEKWLSIAKQLTLKVNDILIPLFAAANITLVDYKLEFGVYDNQLLLGDEFTPDGCRLWDMKDSTSLDKDRFRQDLGDVITSYTLVGKRLGIDFSAV
jgi:phosphoribosylaminoimidazole-succinocarboxamide synthase